MNRRQKRLESSAGCSFLGHQVRRVSSWIAVLLLAKPALAVFPLESPCDPYAVGLHTAKLTTPQWVGEPDVDAVVILSIDDMRDTAKYEAFLRPILERLKRIDGKAPLSIFTNSIDPNDPTLQTWLQEGLSIEVHTVDHPCPLLRDGDFQKAKSTYDRCVDMMSAIPGSSPVAFRMPCCDSLNTPSPRFWTEIFERVTRQGNWLSIDSSVFNIFTQDDPDLPSDLTTNEQGKPRFRSYLPFKSFVNTIENYPYPYIVGASCWEFPCVVPSDWEAQNVQEPNNPNTVRDLKRALDATVIKQGVMPIVFHPHNWIRNDQLVEFIDYADKAYGRRVKFMTFAGALQSINQNLLDGTALRTARGNEFGVRLVDVNGDGYLDVMRRRDDELQTRLWVPGSRSFVDEAQAISFTNPHFFRQHGQLSFSVADPKEGLLIYKRTEDHWAASPLSWSKLGLSAEWKRALAKPHLFQDQRWRDLDADGTSELLLTLNDSTIVLGWRNNSLQRLPFDLPVALARAGREDSGIRFVDLDNDGRDDVVLADGNRYGVWPFESLEDGWRQLRSGLADDAGAIPMIARPDGTNNGAWFHSGHVWVQNEYTNRLPDLVQRASFAELTNDNDGDKHPLGQAKSLSESVTTFQLIPGTELYVVAAEPQVQDPIAFDWGPDGRLWVAEMGGLSERP